MSGMFASDWLALREAADTAARNSGLRAKLACLLPDARGHGMTVLDLGAGTAANLRALAPGLGRGQRWWLLDHDAGLLDQAAHILKRWCREAGWEARVQGRELCLQAADWDARVRIRQCDLSGDGLDRLPTARLVTGSALLDLVSAGWLQRLVQTSPETCFYFPLNYDGSMKFFPALDLDREVCGLFNRHQKGDKGFGPALGGDAPRLAGELLGMAGFNCENAESAWRLGPEDGPLQVELLEGIAGAAGELSEQKEAVEAWHRQRMTFVEEGRSLISIGHRDLLAMPSGGQRGL